MKAKYDLNGPNGTGAPFDLQLFLRITEPKAKTKSYLAKEIIYSQADPASTLFLIRHGRVKLTVISSEGKAATIAVLDKGDFLGEECLLLSHSVRRSSAITLTECSLVQIDKDQMLSALDRDRDLARSFTEYLLERKLRAEEGLTDWFFHSSEKRLVRMLLLLAGSGTSEITAGNLPEISQEALAEMVGTTRPRISYFMTKFRKLGLVEYSHGLRIRKELQKVLR